MIDRSLVGDYLKERGSKESLREKDEYSDDGHDVGSMCIRNYYF